MEALLWLQTLSNGWYILTMRSALQRSVLGTMAAYAFVSAGMGAIMRCWVEAGFAHTELYRRLFLDLACFGLYRYGYHDLLVSPWPTSAPCEPIRTDEFTHRKMTFFHDPDNLPLELHE